MRADRKRRRRRTGRRLVLILLLLAVIAAEGVVLRGYLLPSRSAAPADWRLVLVNARHPVPEDCAPELTELKNGKQVDKRILPDLQRMFDDARAQGLSPTVSEGYRTRAEQEAMMERYVADYLAQGHTEREARRLAREYVAEPGTSEHELGLAVDVGSTEDGGTAALYPWLMENAHRYGFILRYPDGKEDVTGITYEPWHYRYVGPEAAADIYARGLTLEEYLEG